MPDPTIVALDQHDPELDVNHIRDNLEQAAALISSQVPIRYRSAIVDVPEIAEWVRSLVELGKNSRGSCPVVTTGPSLLLLGATGTGKTYAAYGAVRALSVSGVRCKWSLVTAADIYARLRPRPRIDSEEEFESLARTTLLVIDDLGVAKATEWTEEVNYRLINHRYEHMKPTLITSNVPPRELTAAVGERVASRLTEMTTRIVLKGPDRRRETKKTNQNIMTPHYGRPYR